ncbi:hypothetical protein DSL72_002249 [Monilinia vaccinii-corymbosi]|uniref:Uncharacterized protein n=1 Tax=Monilinia vaccinii-corymbosi TaxID=61207 RepID=A0A8A3PC35_9HELO|nr:hypothetical protein DSL72_002249 [Monilinia vaccinii-corymbosi]
MVQNYLVYECGHEEPEVPSMPMKFKRALSSKKQQSKDIPAEGQCEKCKLDEAADREARKAHYDQAWVDQIARSQKAEQASCARRLEDMVEADLLAREMGTSAESVAQEIGMTTEGPIKRRKRRTNTLRSQLT